MTEIILTTDKPSYHWKEPVTGTISITDLGSPISANIAVFLNGIQKFTTIIFGSYQYDNLESPTSGSSMAIRVDYLGYSPVPGVNEHPPASVTLTVPLTRPPPVSTIGAPTRIPTYVDVSGPFPGYEGQPLKAYSDFYIGYSVRRGDSYFNEVVGALVNVYLDGKFKGQVDTAEQNLLGWQSILVPPKDGMHELKGVFIGNDDFEPSEQIIRFEVYGSPPEMASANLVPALGAGAILSVGAALLVAVTKSKK